VKVSAALAACGLLCACAGVNEGGLANYDALRKAAAACEAKGGELRLQNGGNPEMISDFSCKRK
jgi:hypothetical protein